MSDTTLLQEKKKKQQETISKPKLGFLGVGWIGKNRMEAVYNSQHATISSICDSYDGNLQTALEVVKDAEKADSFESMLDSDVDGVVIATPSALHASQSIAALEKGKAVFCQKPLGRNKEETRAVVDLARKKDLLLGVDFSYRFTCFRKIYDIIQSGELGDIYSIELVFHNAWGPDKPWFYDPKQAGGGCVVDLGVHLVDLALWSLNNPEVKDVRSNLYAQGKPLKNPEEQVEDYATAIMQLDSSHGKQTSMQLTCSWNLPAGKEAEIQASFYGTNGGVAFRNINGSFYDFKALRFNKTQTEVLFEGQDDWGGRAAVDWAKKLAEGKKFDKEADTLVKVAEVLDRIYGR